MPAAKQTDGGRVTVRMLLTASSGDFGIFYAGQEYTVGKDAAKWLLEDDRVAVPVNKADSATERR